MKKFFGSMPAWLLMLAMLLTLLPGGGIKLQAATPHFEDVLVYGSGSDDGKVVITIMGDGYTAGGQDAFISTATVIANSIVNRYPYSLFKDKINIHAIKVISDVSGLNSGTYFQTFMNTYIVPSATGFQRMRDLVTAYTPTALAKIIVSNTNSYSACAYNGEQTVILGALGTSFAAHEIGHALGQLSDEYTYANNLLEDPNSTLNSNPATVRWKNFVGIGGVGVTLRNGRWYYPSASEADCLMANGRNFCLVCAAAITERMADSAGIPFYGTLFNGVAAANQKPLNTAAAINVPAGTAWIVDFAFHGCNQLKTLSIPASVEKIGEYAFLKCTGLTAITNQALSPQNISAGADRFYGVNRSNITLNVPAGTANAYLAAGWTGFKEIREINAGTNAQVPVIGAQPADMTVNIGAAAQLTVAAAVSRGTLSFQWYETSNRTAAGGTLISGAVNAAYNAPANLAGTKYYYCVVKNTDPAATGGKTAQIATQTAAVTVIDNNDDGNEGDTWEPGRPYLSGETVIYQGMEWQAKWWTTLVPGQGDAWQLLSDTDEYIPGKAYVGGDTVIYQGQTWRAKWWTTSAPGSDGTWELI